MAISISILIVVIGLISLFSLPVEQYPDIAPPSWISCYIIIFHNF